MATQVLAQEERDILWAKIRALEESRDKWRERARRAEIALVSGPAEKKCNPCADTVEKDSV